MVQPGTNLRLQQIHQQGPDPVDESVAHCTGGKTSLPFEWCERIKLVFPQSTFITV